MKLHFNYQKALDIINQDGFEHNLFRLANWLRECRNCLNFEGDDFNTLEIDKATSDSVFNFYERWKERTSGLCDTDIFKTAIHMQGLHKGEIILKTHDGEFDITDELYKSFEENSPFCNMSEQISKREEKRFREYQKEIKNFLYYGRSKLAYLISELKEATIKYEISAFANEFENDSEKSWKELLPLLSRRKLNYFPKKIYNANTYTDYLFNQLQQAKVGKNAYYAYIDMDSKSETQKVFCTNLSFFLCLTLDEAELLHNNEGYTIELSKRESADILKNCFKHGLSWEYANVLLNRYGYKYLDISREKKKPVINTD